MQEALDFVAIDVEPGGKTKPWGSLGVAECVNGELADPFTIRFLSPHYSSHPDGSQSLTAAEAITLLAAFVGARLIVFFHAKYDVPAIRRLALAGSFSPPAGEYICAELLAQHSTPKVAWRSSLQDWVLHFGLLDPADIARRRAIHRDAPQQKWLLWTKLSSPALVASDISFVTAGGRRVATWIRPRS